MAWLVASSCMRHARHTGRAGSARELADPSFCQINQKGSRARSSVPNHILGLLGGINMNSNTPRFASSLLLCLGTLGVGLIDSQPAFAQLSPCMESNKTPCVRPGNPSLGDNGVGLYGGLGTYNSHNLDSSYFGPSITPAGGYIKREKEALVLVDSDGSRTRFISAGGGRGAPVATYWSENRFRSGDYRTIDESSTGLSLLFPTSGDIVEYRHTRGRFSFPTAYINALGHTTYTVTYQNGVPQSAIDSQSEVRTTFESSNGRITVIKNSLDAKYTLSYDKLGRLEKIAFGDKNAQLFTYNNQGLLTEVKDHDNNKVVFGYDGRLLTTTKDQLGYGTSRRYDANSTTFTYSQPGGSSYVERLEFASFAGEPLVVKQLTGRSQGSLDTVVSFRRDQAGAVVASTDLNNDTTTYTIKDGLPVASSSKYGSSIREFDALGRLVKETKYDPRGEIVTSSKVEYEGFKLTRLQIDDNKGGNLFTKKVGYRVSGRGGPVLAMTEETSGSEKMGYDQLHRLTSIAGPSGMLAIEHSNAGGILSLTRNGVKTSYKESYSQKGYSVMKTDPWTASTLEQNVLGTVASLMFGDVGGKLVTAMNSVMTGSMKQGSLTKTFTDTILGAWWERWKWGNASWNKSESTYTSGRGSPPAGG